MDTGTPGGYKFKSHAGCLTPHFAGFKVRHFLQNINNSHFFSSLWTGVSVFYAGDQEVLAKSWALNQNLAVAWKINNILPFLFNQ